MCISCVFCFNAPPSVVLLSLDGAVFMFIYTRSYTLVPQEVNDVLLIGHANSAAVALFVLIRFRCLFNTRLRTRCGLKAVALR